MTWGDILFDYLAFLAKTFTVVIAFLVVLASIFSARLSTRKKPQGYLEVKKINQVLNDYRDLLQGVILSAAELKSYIKQRNRQHKKEAKAQSARRRLFFLEFKGDIQAEGANALSREVSAILTSSDAEDEVLVSIESSGGTVNGYGFAASQLQRIRKAGIRLTVAIDKVAASGGYLMAVVSDRIIAAPFAVVGSIGVVAQIPNFHRLLKKNDVDVDIFTSGEFKRTVTVFGENTEVGREKFQSQLDLIHQQFRSLVLKYRPDIDIDKVGTGETWLAEQALELGLVDDLITSDDYLMEACREKDVFKIKWVPKLSPMGRLAYRLESAVTRWLRSLGLVHSGTRDL